MDSILISIWKGTGKVDVQYNTYYNTLFLNIHYKIINTFVILLNDVNEYFFFSNFINYHLIYIFF